jgi:arylsulfatase A-like enzyme
MVSELDGAIGRVVDALDNAGMLDNTLIWFMSDNGGLNPSAHAPGLISLARRMESWFGRPLPGASFEFLRTNALDGGADNSPLRKGKGSVYEGGARVPAFVYWRARRGRNRARCGRVRWRGPLARHRCHRRCGNA